MAVAKPRPGLVERTPIAEWIAAALGLVLTLGLLGYLVREAVTDRGGAPRLSITSQAPEASVGGFVVPITVRNESDATAADLEVRATLERAGQVIEERRMSFTYVPGGGEARGGLVFQNDPSHHRLTVRPEGYEEP